MFNVPERYRVMKGPYATTLSDGNMGEFVIPSAGGSMRIHMQCFASAGLDSDDPLLALISPDGVQWEHVSIVMINITHSGKTHHLGRCPTWEEMCYVKELFWDDPEDTVIQFHPPKSEYVSQHPHCLHLWRPVDKDKNPILLPRPLPMMVGRQPKPKVETPTPQPNGNDSTEETQNQPETH